MISPTEHRDRAASTDAEEAAISVRSLRRTFKGAMAAILTGLSLRTIARYDRS